MKTDKNLFRDIIVLALAAASILLVPLLAMQFTKEVNWVAGDFIAAWVLLFGAGLVYRLIIRKSSKLVYRTAAGIMVFSVLLLIWMNLAVGIIGSEDNPVNLLYIGVIAVSIIGSFIARFQPAGMAYTLFAAALTQLLVPVIAIIIMKPGIASGEELLGVLGVFGVNAFFALLFIVSALLFRHAANNSLQVQR